MNEPICYEQPLNERSRMLLRLEYVFQQIDRYRSGDSPWDSRQCLEGLLDLFNLIGRNEIKVELLKELDRHTTTLTRLKDTPGVDTQALEGFLSRLEQITSGVHGTDNLQFDEVRKNELLNAVRQRSTIPGGSCSFDRPALHHWLNHGFRERQRDLNGWLRPFQPLQEAVLLLLRLIRSSAVPSEEVAREGFFHKGLNGTAPNQLVQVLVEREHGVFPEISAGRQRVSVRFMEQPDPAHRPRPFGQDVPFRLVCCVI
ncbi:MAG: cell division protein ZapD [Candidatus Competibacteraceae bacterium]|nr:cell division protein ZapD [Candidatus Competibacteraceae bacterium]